MKIEQIKIDDLTFQLVVNIEKADAQEKKKQALIAKFQEVKDEGK